jgi:hypothetical protein
MPTESSIQRAVNQWILKNIKSLDELKSFTAIGHQGGAGGFATGIQRKHEGVRKGVPDMALLQPSGGYSALFIELKLPWGRASKAQEDWIVRLNNNGYLAIIIYTVRPSVVIKIITTYLKSPDLVKDLLTSKTLDADFCF